MTESMEIPPELFGRLAHPTVRLSGSIDEATAASFLSLVLPVLEVPGSTCSGPALQARARGYLSFYLRPAGGSTSVPEFGLPCHRFEAYFENTANAVRVANRGKPSTDSTDSWSLNWPIPLLGSPVLDRDCD